MPDKGGQNHKIKIKIKYKKVTTQCYASKPQTEWHTESVRYKKLQECCLTPHKTLPETRLSMKLITAAHNAQEKSNHEMQYTYYDKAGGGGGGGEGGGGVCVCVHGWVHACVEESLGKRGCRKGDEGKGQWGKGMQGGGYGEETVGKRMQDGDCGQRDAKTRMRGGGLGVGWRKGDRMGWGEGTVRKGMGEGTVGIRM